MASTFSQNFHDRPHVDASLFLKALLSRAHRPRTSGANDLVRIPGAEWFELQIGQFLAGGRDLLQRLQLRQRAERLRALSESEVGSLLFFLVLILVTFLI